MSGQRNEPDPPSGGEGISDPRLRKVYQQVLASLKAGQTIEVSGLFSDCPELSDQLPALIEQAKSEGVTSSWLLPEIPGYTILRELDRGGMSVVYIARDKKLDREVVLKVLPSWKCSSGPARERFLREAHTLAKLQHPNVVTIHDIIETDDLLACSLEWIRGCGLHHLILALQKVEPDGRMGRLREMLPDADPALLSRGFEFFILKTHLAIALALSRVHAAELVHRDVKPSNILLRPDGTAVLADFGIVHSDEAATLTEGYLGTPIYSAPEQFSDSVEADPRADVYSLGMTLYESIALRQPLDGTTSAEVIRSIERGEIAALRTVISVSKDFETVVTKATDPDPARRYNTIDAFAADLEALIEGKPVAARPLSILVRSMRWVRREPMRVAMVVALASSLGFGTLLYLQGTGQTEFVSESREKTPHVVDSTFLSFVDPLLHSEGPSSFALLLEKNPGDVPSVVGLSMSHQFAGREKDALQVLEAHRDLFAANPLLERWHTAGADIRVYLDASRDLATSTAFEAFFAGFCAYRIGTRTLDRKDYTYALGQFENAVLSSGQSPVETYFIYTAKTLAQLEDTNRLATYAQKIREKFPQSASARRGIASAYRLLDPKLSLVACDEADSLLPGTPSVAIERGTAHIHLGDELGIDILKKVAEENPKLLSAHGEYATGLLVAGRVTEAKKQVLASIDRFGGNSKFYFTLGRAHHRLKELDLAIAAYEKCVRLDPDYYEAWGNLAIMHDKLDPGRVSERALECFVRAADIATGHFVTQRNLYIALSKAGRELEAETCLQRCVSCKPDDFYSHYFLGRILCLKNSHAEAIVPLERAHQMKAPKGKNYMRHRDLIELYLAEAYKVTGRLAESYDLISHVRNQLDIQRPDFRVHSILGELYLNPNFGERYEPERAVEELNIALTAARFQLKKPTLRIKPSVMREEIRVLEVLIEQAEKR